MSESTDPITEPTRRRRWRQFSLRALLILMTAVVFIVGPWMNGVRKQRRAVEVIHSLEGYITYETVGIARLVPQGIRDKFPEDYFSSVVGVTLNHRTINRRMTTLTPDELDRVVDAMTMLPRMTRLSLHTQALQDDDLAKLKPLAEQIVELRINELYHYRLKSDALVHMEGWPNLVSLTFLSGHTLDRGAGFKSLSKIPNLKSIRIGNTTYEDVCFRAIGEAKSLERVDLWQCRFEGSSLRHLRKLPNLKSVSLPNLRPVIANEYYEKSENGELIPRRQPSYRFERAGEGGVSEQVERGEFENWLKVTLPGVSIHEITIF